MQAKVLPIKFRGWKFCGWPVDCKNLKNYIPWKIVCIRHCKQMETIFNVKFWLSTAVYQAQVPVCPSDHHFNISAMSALIDRIFCILGPQSKFWQVHIYIHWLIWVHKRHRHSLYNFRPEQLDCSTHNPEFMSITCQFFFSVTRLPKLGIRKVLRFYMTENVTNFMLYICSIREYIASRLSRHWRLYIVRQRELAMTISCRL